MADINKIGAIVIRDKKMLVCAKKGLDVLISLGGKIEPGETHEECLRREVREEAQCGIAGIRYFDTFRSPAAEIEGNKIIEMHCYFCELDGEPKINPKDKVYAFQWIGRDYKERGYKIAPLMENHLVPALIKEGIL